MPRKYIVIGGSAGSFQTVLKILETLPKGYPYAVILVLHRLKNVKGGFIEALSVKSKLKLIEPKDKTKIEASKIYLAPSNYHLYVEFDNTFVLSTEETVNHSRPSIDITFSSIAFSFKEKVVGILLSGANRDGAEGLLNIAKNGGYTIVQEPENAQIQTMPQAAINLFEPNKIFTDDQIVDFLKNYKL